MKQIFAKAFSVGVSGILALGLFPFTLFGQTNSLKFDDFNRSNNLVIGSSVGTSGQTWLETETTGSNDFRARVENNMLVFSSMNNVGAGSSGLEQVSVNAENLYTPIFNQAAENLVWSFNFRQSRVNPSGFGATTYGIAYVLGCTHANFTNATASGYAIIIGNSNSPDPVKLVRFTNGLTANSNLTNVITSTETSENAYFSIKVSYDPCAKTWSLQIRNDGATAFADPSTVSVAALTAVDQTFTNSKLNYTGAAFNHGAVNETAFFDNIYLPNVQASTTSYTWTGAVSSDFTEPLNWSPVRNCLKNNDILKFNSGKANFLTNVTSQTVSSFWVTNNTVLTLKAKTGAAQTITILDGDNQDLVVEAGSSLIIDSNDALVLSLSSGATGNVAGTFTVQNSAMNLGRAHRLLATDAGSVIFESGSYFFARNLSGEPFGNSGIANAVIFRKNATYISRDGASPFGLASPNSKVIFETGSLYRHEQTGTAPKLDGRAYADFELNVTGNLAIIFGTSAINPTRINNFTISSGTMNITLASGTNPLPLQINGNLTVASGALLNFSPSSTTNASTISMSGTSSQVISGPIILGANATMEVNNSAGITLKSPLNIAGKLQLSQGILALDPTVSISFEDNALALGGSATSYIAGKVIKTGDDAFIFPVGKNGYFAPIGISGPLNVTDKFAAEYFPVDPSTIFGSLRQDSLVRISGTEYWDLERVNGNSEVKVSLSYHSSRSLPVSRQEDLRVAHFKGAAGWQNEGLATISSQPEFIMLSASNFQSSFSPFTFAAVTTNSPLPVELLAFQAKIQSENVILSWETASEINSRYFEVQRSKDGRAFSPIGQVAAAGNSSSRNRYHFTDQFPTVGIMYYRLKQVDLDGTATFSPIVSVTLAASNPELLIYPNPVKNQITISNSGKANQGSIQIINSIGQVVKTGILTGTMVQLDLSILPAGVYQVRFSSATGSTVRKFIKS